MLIAHLPLGYLLSRPIKNIWTKGKNTVADLGTKKRRILWIIFLISTILPDGDFLYYIIFGQGGHHHYSLGHLPLFYITLGLIFWLVSILIKRDFVRLVGLSITIGAMFHLLGDSLSHGILWLFPFSDRLVGVYFIEKFYPLLYTNKFVFNYSMETVVIAVFLWVIGRQYRPKAPQWHLNVFVAGFVLISFSGILTLNQYLYRTAAQVALDVNGDGILNDSGLDVYDDDMDGDGIPNIIDNDANGNGVVNLTEFLNSINSNQGVLYNPVAGKLLDVPRWWGLVTISDVYYRALLTAGIHLPKEITADFEKNPGVYNFKPNNTPKNSQFVYELDNLAVFLNQKSYLLPKSTTVRQGQPAELRSALLAGDIVFYGENYSRAVIVLEVYDSEHWQGAMIDSEIAILSFMPNQFIEKIYGKPRAIGRLESLENRGSVTGNK